MPLSNRPRSSPPSVLLARYNAPSRVALAHVLGAGRNSPPAVIAYGLANFTDPRTSSARIGEMRRHAHQPASACRSRVSRFGAIPKPTVTVRMEENGVAAGVCGRRASQARFPPP